MVAVDKFVGDLKQFFKDVQKFLLENLEEYSMGAEDDAERDRLVSIIRRLDTEAASLSADGAVQEEVYDDNVVLPQEEEYLAPSEQELTRPPKPPSRMIVPKPPEEGLITEDTYEDPNTTKSDSAPADAGIMEETYEDPNTPAPHSAVQDEGGLMEDTYEDPYADKKVTKPPPKEEEGIMEDMYEDPYADRKVVNPQPKEEEGEGVMEEMYEDPYADRPVPGKDKKAGAKKKKEKKTHKKSASDDTVSTRSDESNEGSALTAAQVQEGSGIYGPLRKQNGKKRNVLTDKTYWGAVKDKILYYFEGKAKKYKGQISLNDFTASEADKKKFVFQLTCPGRKTFFFAALNEKDLNDWITYINTNRMPEKEEEAAATETVQKEEGEEEVEMEGDLYELEEPGARTESPSAKVEEEEEEGTMEELYEDPGDYQDHKVVRPGAVEEVSAEGEVYDDTVAGERPNLPPRDCDKNGAPPPLPHRDCDSKESRPPPPLPDRDCDSKPAPALPDRDRSPIHPPPAAATEIESEELYDDTSTPMVIVDGEEVYDDGTSAHALPPPPPSPPLPDKQETLPPPPPVNMAAMYYGLWACEEVTDSELCFSSGACIEVLNKDKYGQAGWWVGRLGNKVGLVPKDYLYPMYKQV